MRTYDEYRVILAHWENRVNKKAIARLTGIPRATVRDCINRFGSRDNFERYADANRTPELVHILRGEPELKQQENQAFEQASVEEDADAIIKTVKSVAGNPEYCEVNKAYAYMLGLYLGDGSISRNRRVYRIRVSLDARYPGIIESCKQALTVLLPGNQIGIVEHYYHDRLSYVDVSCFYKHWPDVFPQHGIGMKHTRTIQLELWQQGIVDEYPLQFWKGLYHSDGSRFSNVVNGKDYPRYQFTNMSRDIIRLYCNICDKLGLQWTEKTRRPKPDAAHHDTSTDVYISKRKDVEFLDREVGPKW
jgi:hypothetical protein